MEMKDCQGLSLVIDIISFLTSLTYVEVEKMTGVNILYVINWESQPIIGLMRVRGGRNPVPGAVRSGAKLSEVRDRFNETESVGNGAQNTPICHNKAVISCTCVCQTSGTTRKYNGRLIIDVGQK